MRNVFLVTREPGKRWQTGRALRDQPDWDEHATFMSRLFEEGVLLFGGPLGEDPGRVVLVAAAASREEVLERLAPDPWLRYDVLNVASVKTWTWYLGS
jgi:uncharacterized protein YciI